MTKIESYSHLYNYCTRVCINQGKKEIIEDNKEKFTQVCKLYFNVHKNKEIFKLLESMRLKSVGEIFIQIVKESMTMDEILLDSKEIIGVLIDLKSDNNFKKENYPLLFPRFNISSSIVVEQLKQLDSLLEGVNISKNLEEVCLNPPSKFGIYMFFDENKEIIYIGKSTSDLISRMLQSLEQKDYPAYVMLGYPKTKSDTNVYEVYYISKYKPRMNKESKNNDELTIELPDIEFSDLISTFDKANITNYKERLDNIIEKQF